jgi:hypothetical protein
MTINTVQVSSYWYISRLDRCGFRHRESIRPLRPCPLSALQLLSTSFPMAAVTTIGFLNPHQPDSIIVVFYGSHHRCNVKIFPLPGTDMANMNRNRKCILVSRGRVEYIGLHLDL